MSESAAVISTPAKSGNLGNNLVVSSPRRVNIQFQRDGCPKQLGKVRSNNGNLC